MKTISLTASDIEALAECLEFGRERMVESLDNDVAADFDDEWPEVADLMARNWRDAGLVLQALGKPEEGAACQTLSTRLYESAADASAKAREAKGTPDDDGIAAE